MDYIYHIAVMVGIYIILTSSLNLLIGYAGLFALSHAGFYALGAYSVAILATNFDLMFPIPLLIGAVFTGVVGGLIALPALRIGGHYLVIITMAFQVILLSVILNSKPLTGGPDGISGIPRIEFFLARYWRRTGSMPSLSGSFQLCVSGFAAGLHPRLSGAHLEPCVRMKRRPKQSARISFT